MVLGGLLGCLSSLLSYLSIGLILCGLVVVLGALLGYWVDYLVYCHTCLLV